MTRLSYTYSVVRYVHDPAAGELMNVGIVLYAPSVRFFGLRVEPRFKRLSEAFAGFDGEQYRRALRHLETAVADLWDQLAGGLPDLFDLPPDVGSLVSRVWPDADLSFRIGPTLAGVGTDPPAALDSIFERMVTNQYERPIVTTRTDDEIWQTYVRPIPPTVRRLLTEKVLMSDDYELKFPHAFKNGQWHLIQPVTLDYANGNEIQDKATRWLGRTTLIRDNPEVGTLYLLLGAPSREENSRAYVRAKNILRKLPVNHKIVEENEASDFARHLTDYMRQHGIVPSSEQEVATVPDQPTERAQAKRK